MKFQNKPKISFLLFPVLLLLSGCADKVQNAFPSFVPQNLLVDCSEDDLLEMMLDALENAEGLTDIWLIEFAGTAQECNIRQDGLQEYTKRTK